MHISWCSEGGVDTMTASTSSRTMASRQSMTCAAPGTIAATFAAFVPSVSAVTIRRQPAARASALARRMPMSPQPTRAKRSALSSVADAMVTS
jgi:hypothetical protein